MVWGWLDIATLPLEMDAGSEESKERTEFLELDLSE